MTFFNLIPYYFAWHYTGALGNIMKILGNYIWFISNYFSLKIIFFSFFKPYKKLTEENYYKKDSENFFVTLIMKLVGVVMRIGVIVTGISTIILILILGVFIFLIWFIAPIFLTIIFMMGFVALIY